MKLELKTEYIGSKVSIKHPTMGVITFDSLLVKETDYPFYNMNGFSHLFTKDEIIPAKKKRVTKKK